MNNEKREFSALRTFFIILGAIVSIAAVVAGLYYVCKKYFNITFECASDDDECDSEGRFVEEDDSKFVPVCEVSEEPEDDVSFED